MHENDDLETRLHRLAETPVPAPVRSAHLTRAGGTTPVRRFNRWAVAGAAIVGFLAGSTGFAMAGALPDQAQDVAHDVLGAVNVDVPQSEHGKCISEAATTHRGDVEAKQAAKALCAKPGKGHAGDHGPDSDEGEGSGCGGAPPWAGRGKPTAEEKAAFKASKAGCADDAGDEQEEAEEPAPNSGAADDQNSSSTPGDDSEVVEPGSGSEAPGSEGSAPDGAGSEGTGSADPGSSAESSAGQAGSGEGTGS